MFKESFRTVFTILYFFGNFQVKKRKEKTTLTFSQKKPIIAYSLSHTIRKYKDHMH